MHELAPHPDMVDVPPLAIRADARRVAEGLRFAWIVEGDIASLVLPKTEKPGFADGLWRTTCFEAFVRRGADHGYLEYNFAPSGNWAIYRFDDYRRGMAKVETDPAPAVAAMIFERRLEIVATAPLPQGHDDAALNIGLAAILETRDGAIAHWALRHPSGPPDFHHRDCFASRLRAAGA